MRPTSTRPAAGIARRDLIRRSAALGLAAAPALGALTGCATGFGGASVSDNVAKSRGQTSPANPLGAKRGLPVEAFIFKGGLGDSYARDAEADYTATYGARVVHTGTQQIGPKLQPRIAGGDPPDVIDNSGADHLDMNNLSQQGRLVDLGPLLDAPTFDDPAKKVRDTLFPSTLAKGRHGDTFDVLYYAFTVYGTWYSQKLLDDRGWEYPTSLDGMLELCREIKKDGIAPWAYPGKYPYYTHWNIFGQIAKIGGLEKWLAIDNLEPNAWTSNDAARRVIEFYEEMAAKRYFLAGSEGRTHTQTQTKWNQYEAVFIPNGSWVENEAEPTTPKDFRMAVGVLLDGGAHDAMPRGTVYAEPSEPYVVAADGRNPTGGMELLRIMLSRKHAQNFARKVKSLTSVKDSTAGLALSPGLASASRAVAEGGDNLIMAQLRDWYPKLTDERIGGLTSDLLTGDIRARDWIRKAQKYADEVAADRSVTKFTRSA
ncbi:N-acetylglucosamine/diacetylchitobiose ABC transporter substrate-binding protein [Streptomyces sp. B1866]|uniref:N-acetylglucosamine/diacetylchitobiose ABC transporter substrate-binding protein n=1 Tax=Streptomyces sp. B1866 TaxID=3075431 RepID=UPI00288F591D|nr:N-acetylglucosamine/diacetylchitobiose ABC transporter substrate-binding protein [Streptomyces sp. B1866]MDT3395526.1 N-acetylglucosamine/diacetylchitobiose ABC transporter substrate-binding protein [Streptomyces sp. B1866]